MFQLYCAAASNDHIPICSSRPTDSNPSPPTWDRLPARGCCVPHGATGTRWASRDPTSPRAHRAAGASGVVPGIPCPQPEELPLQEAAVTPPQRPAVDIATQDRLPDQEPRWVERFLKLDSPCDLVKGPCDLLTSVILDPSLLLL